jgi:hypothetical protein
MFQAALDAIVENFPPGNLAGDQGLGHAYVADSGDFSGGGKADGFELAQANSDWGFELDTNPVDHAAQQEVGPAPSP